MNYLRCLKEQTKKIIKIPFIIDYKSLGKSIVRFSRVGIYSPILCGDYIWTYYAYIPLCKYLNTSDNIEEIEHRLNERESRRLCSILLKNKGLYAKLGQSISIMPSVFPPEYINNMKPCFLSSSSSNCSSSSYSIKKIYRIVEEDIHQNPKDLFKSFDPQPIATASISQVYKAVLKSGETVAIKIQHPRIEETTKIDLFLLKLITKSISRLFPSFSCYWKIQELSETLNKELDFSKEIENMEICRQMAKPYKNIVIPTVYRDYCSKRIICMSYEEGISIGDSQTIQNKKINMSSVLSSFVSFYNDMIFKYKYVHADPHMGNILIREKNNHTELVLLDHGLYQSLSPDFIQQYSSFITNTFKGYIDKSRDSIKQILEDTKEGIQKINNKIEEKELYNIEDIFMNIFNTTCTNKDLLNDTDSNKLRNELIKTIMKNMSTLGLCFTRITTNLSMTLKTFNSLRSILIPYDKTNTLYVNFFLSCNQYICQQKNNQANTILESFITKINLYLSTTLQECMKYII
ncbi:hypothetical protein WA158_007505 [Blastocystis sp. Blastoise]